MNTLRKKAAEIPQLSLFIYEIICYNMSKVRERWDTSGRSG